LKYGNGMRGETGRNGNGGNVISEGAQGQITLSNKHKSHMAHVAFAEIAGHHYELMSFPSCKVLIDFSTFALLPGLVARG
jgi:hypothetical protein